jgi:hypothetical protein
VCVCVCVCVCRGEVTNGTRVSVSEGLCLGQRVLMRECTQIDCLPSDT